MKSRQPHYSLKTNANITSNSRLCFSETNLNLLISVTKETLKILNCFIFLTFLFFYIWGLMSRWLLPPVSCINNQKCPFSVITFTSFTCAPLAPPTRCNWIPEFFFLIGWFWQRTCCWLSGLISWLGSSLSASVLFGFVCSVSHGQTQRRQPQHLNKRRWKSRVNPKENQFIWSSVWIRSRDGLSVRYRRCCLIQKHENLQQTITPSPGHSPTRFVMSPSLTTNVVLEDNCEDADGPTSPKSSSPGE